MDRSDACFEIAAQAADIVRATRTHTASWKARGDLVTPADEASEAFIAAAIRNRFPDDRIVCEEGTEYGGTSGYLWLCDPLDGTLNFARDMAPWAVSLAVLHGDEVIAGCVVEGANQDVFTASRGDGARRNGQRISVSETAFLRESLVAFDCPYNMTARMTTTYHAVGELLQVSAALRCYGSCAVALCKIACGEIDVYAVEHGKPWDFAAGILLVEEAGGKVSRWCGRRYDPQRHLQILATNGVLHDAALTATKPHASEPKRADVETSIVAPQVSA